MSKVPDRARPTITSRLGVSVPGAIGALLFAGALAFGSGMIDAVAPGQSGDETAQLDSANKPADGSGQDGSGQNGTGQNGTGQGGGDSKPADSTQEDFQEPDHSTPDKTPKPEPTPKLEPKPTDQAQPKPPAPPAPTTGLTLETFAADGRVKLAWSVFGGDGFAGYKVVRSSDASVSWPLGSGDALIAFAGDPYVTYYKDVPACGTTWHYRVFAVASSATGYQVLAASNVGTGFFECVSKPTPPPVHQMDFSAEVIDGQVHLTWEACTSDGFVAYKVVRSQTNTNPKYPLNEGTELIAAIGDHTVTSLVDTNVQTGQTWTYRVLSLADDGWGWYPIGMTPVLTVTIP